MSAPITYIHVILPLKIEWTPCYSLPSSITEDDIRIGDRVRVRFSFKEYIGVISAIGVIPEINPSKIHPILSVERSIERILPEEIKLWQQVAGYYMCTVGEVYKAAYPVSKINLEEARAAALEKIRERKLRMIGSISEKKDRLVQRLRKKEEQEAHTREGSKAKTKLQDEIRKITDELHRIEGALENARRQLDRTIPEAKDRVIPECSITLTCAQEDAYQEILKGFAMNKPVLLHGVTGSGKTEIYIRTAHEILKTGRNVLYLVPEIALSRQLEDRLERHFGERLMVFHSGESAASKRNTAEAIRHAAHTGSPYIVLGTRSSLFLPHHDLGLIIVDEEHDSSYKQDSPAPRYNGRDTAIMLARLQSSHILMGSATPSLESSYNCMVDRHILVELHDRYHGSENCVTEIIDTKAEKRKNGMCGSFSYKLIEQIRKTLDEGGQIMLLRSRRSWAPALQCDSCGSILRCPHCNVSLSLHKSDSATPLVRCHYCGHTEYFTPQCPECSGSLKGIGAGTQKIEEEAQELFPAARIARLDADTAQSKDYDKKTVKAFAKGEIDILIGTQMLAKGFDFSNLSLVAVLSADTLLGIQDFRADEKAYQLLEQFKGRCGRRGQKALFMIQTSQPEHPVYTRLLHAAADHVQEDLLQERCTFSLPPYTRMIEVTMKDTDESRLKNTAMQLYQRLDTALSSRNALPAVTFPYTPAVDKVADNHIMTIRISLAKDRSLAEMKNRIAKEIRLFEKTSKRDGYISVNVDPS